MAEHGLLIVGGRVATAAGVRFWRRPRVTKTSRFSYQREFAEFYSVTPESDAWRTNGVAGAGLTLVETKRLKPLSRCAPYPSFALDGTFRPVRHTVLRRDANKFVKDLPRLSKAGKSPLKYTEGTL